jgi:hypothetical protein
MASVGRKEEIVRAVTETFALTMTSEEASTIKAVLGQFDDEGVLGDMYHALENAGVKDIPYDFPVSVYGETLYNPVLVWNS